MSGFSTVAAALVGLTLAIPVAAQSAPKQPGAPAQAASPEAWQEITSFGRCYAVRRTGNALKLIASEPNTEGERAIYKALLLNPNQPCITGGNRLSAPHYMVRGAIADGLYQGRVPLPPALLLSAPAPGTARTLAEAARCFVKTDEADARALAETGPGSDAERALVTRILPAFEKCLPASAALDSNLTLFRYRVVEALFRTGVVRSAVGAAR